MAAYRFRVAALLVVLLLLVLVHVPGAAASVGDQLPEFHECIEICKAENCGPGKPPTPIPLHRRLLLWTCASECDQTCQRLVTQRRTARGLPVVQFHGKWPFRRLFGVQEPASVLFSLGNLWAHAAGLRRLRRRVPAAYPLRPYYVGFGVAGLVSWVASAVFHTRDFLVTERLDYFAAGASVLYGLYYTPLRVFRLVDGSGTTSGGGRRHGSGPTKRGSSTAASFPLLPAWTALCLCLYAAHVGYLTLVRWDYTYNMAANVVCGVVQNALWSVFSWRTWRRTRRQWAVWPGLAVAWVTLAMSLELFDFPPALGVVDAHSLWHLGTIGPTVLWYNFLVKDALEDINSRDRLIKDYKE